MTLDPQAKAFLELADRSGRPLFETLDPAAARALYDETAAIAGGPAPDVFRVEDLDATGPFGPHSVAGLHAPAIRPDPRCRC